MSPLTRPALPSRSWVTTIEQSLSPKMSRRVSESVFVATSRNCSTGRPMSRASAARSESATRHLSLRRASGRAESFSTVRGGAHARENVNVSASAPVFRETYNLSGGILEILSIPLKTARSVNWEDMINSSKPSSARPFPVKLSSQSPKVTFNEEKLMLVFVAFTRQTTSFYSLTFCTSVPWFREHIDLKGFVAARSTARGLNISFLSSSGQAVLSFKKY